MRATSSHSARSRSWFSRTALMACSAVMAVAAMGCGDGGNPSSRSAMGDGGADATGTPADVAGDGPLGTIEKVLWAQSLTGRDSEYVEDVAVVSGDVLVVGEFTEELVLA